MWNVIIYGALLSLCDAHNTLWCGRNERECEIPDREGEGIIGIYRTHYKNYRIKYYYRIIQDEYYRTPYLFF